MSSLFSIPIDSRKYSPPKRIRLSLKLQLEHSSRETDDTSISLNCKVQGENDSNFKNISPDPKILEVKLPAFISADVVNKKQEVSAVGLPNCGNTCYLNSVLQVLRYTPMFLNTLHSLMIAQNSLDQISSKPVVVTETNLFIRLHSLYTSMKKQEDILYNNYYEDHHSSSLYSEVQSFLASLWEVSSLFEEGQQHDAHEFLLTLISEYDVFYKTLKANASVYFNGNGDLDSSNIFLLKEKKRLTLRLKRELRSRLDIFNCEFGFEGKIRHCITCIECETRVEHIEPFTNLEVSISDDFIAEETADLCQCLVQKTVVKGEDKYFCNSCYHPTEAVLCSEVTSLPSILMLHCSWFRKSSHFTDVGKVDIPLVLKTAENRDIFQVAADKVYILYAVVLHVGTSVDQGHYVSFVRETPEVASCLKNYYSADLESCCARNMSTDFTNNWLLYDDENVLPLCITDASIFPYYKYLTMSASPCMIFYYKM